MTAKHQDAKNEQQDGADECTNAKNEQQDRADECTDAKNEQQDGADEQQDGSKGTIITETWH